MRTELSVKNSIFATIMIVIKILITFLAQKIFVLILDAEYLGANGLFTNVIGLLSLAELGFGQAIIFNLYKPIANDDKETIKSLMKLYQKAYNWITISIAIIGMAIIPFLGFFIGETTLNLNFTLVYILFLSQALASYVLTYKRSILYAYQENYIVSIIDMIYIIVMNVAQLSVLYITKNYYLYLVIKGVCIFIENIIITFIANKKYSFIKDKDVKPLEKTVEKNIFERIKAQIFHRIGGIVVNGTDNIIISKFLGLLMSGLYANYYMILYAVSEVVHQIIAALIPSVGNLLTEENEKRSFDVYKKINFFDFWVTVFASVSILVITQSFVTLWMGELYLLPMGVLVVLVINQYQKMMRQTNDVFLNAAGICIETKYVPIVESILNIVFSILLLKPFGLAGVFIGTIISSMALWCYTYPKFVYKNLLGGKYSNYIKENLIYFLLFVIIAAVTYGISMTFAISNLWLDIIARVALCLVVPNLILFLIYRKSEEFAYFKSLAKFILNKGKKVEMEEA